MGNDVTKAKLTQKLTVVFSNHFGVKQQQCTTKTELGGKQYTFEKETHQTICIIVWF